MSRRNIESSMTPPELEEEARETQEEKQKEQEFKEHSDFIENLFSGGDLERDNALGVTYLDKLRKEAEKRAEELEKKGERMDDFVLRQIQYGVCKEEASRILAMISRSDDLKGAEREARHRGILRRDYTLNDLSNMIYEKLRSREGYVAQSAHLRSHKKEQSE